MPEITANVSFDTIAREWRCKWSPDEDKASLTACQEAIAGVLAEVKAVKGVIDKDIKDEYAAIMARLKSAEGVKLAVLQYDIAEIQKDITRIDEILMSMEEIVSGDPAEATAVQ